MAVSLGTSNTSYRGTKVLVRTFVTWTPEAAVRRMVVVHTETKKGETKGCSMQYTSNFYVNSSLRLTKPACLTYSVCYQVPACQRAERHHPSTTKGSLKVRVLSKIAGTKKKFKVTSKRVCMAENPAALNAVTAY